MSRGTRIHKSTAARKRRKTIKDIIFARTINFYAKMRKKRRNRTAK